MQFIWKKEFFVLLVMLLTACKTNVKQSNNDSEANAIQEHPYVLFKREISSLEPLVESSSIVTTSRNIKPNINNSDLNLPSIRPLELEGDLKLAGSKEILPLNQLIYERFVREGYPSLINFYTIGTDESIKLFCQEKKFDLITLVRPMKEAEIAGCQANDIEPVDFMIGKDAVTIVVSSQNTFINKVNLKTLAEIFTKEQWSDIDSSLPNKSIERYFIEPDASFDLVVEKLFAGDASLLLNAPNTNFYRNQQLMIRQLSNNIYGIGFVSNSVYEKSAKSLKSIVINGATPRSIKVARKIYPLERSLYIYVERKKLKQKSNLSSFINFYLTSIDREIDNARLFSVSSEELNKSKTKWLKLMEIKE